MRAVEPILRPPVAVVLWAPAEGEGKMNLTRLDMEQVKPEVPEDLEEIAAKLLQSARRLPHGPERQKILKQISSFRVRIAALKAKMNY
jgi:hypothetical protein